jgi:hypothetical protein
LGRCGGLHFLNAIIFLQLFHVRYIVGYVTTLEYKAKYTNLPVIFSNITENNINKVLIERRL